MELLDCLLTLPKGPVPPATIVVFGATGDLVTDHGVRKALADLVAHDDLQAGRQRLVFTSRREVTAANFLADVREGDIADEPLSEALLDRLSQLGGFASGSSKLVSVDLGSEQGFDHLPSFADDEVVLFYGALPPSAYAGLIERLAASGLMQPESSRRLVLEKPFGEDLAAAERLASLVEGTFPASQVYLVDHFLEYPGMLEWLSLRGSSAVDQALCKDYVCPQKGVHVRLEETIISNDRAYFRETGIVEDMLQNHAMQILACSCMDLSGEQTAGAWRSRRAAVIEALRWDPGQAARAQVEGFNDVARGSLAGAAPSSVETFATIAFQLDLDRWRGVPMRMTAGKGVSHNRFGIDVYLRKLPPALAQELGLKEEQEACLKATVNKPRFELHAAGAVYPLQPGRPQPARPAYSRVFLDALHGRQAFFVAPRESVAAWRFVQEVQSYWQQSAPELATYPAGASIDSLIGY
jgi:glucose-6-phosphate 1-dehydrogenase